MKTFMQLFEALDQTNKTNEKVNALVRFLEESSADDRIWGVGLLYGKRPKRVVNSRQLQEWAIELSALPQWLFDECYQSVGDLAETIARILPENSMQSERTLAEWMEWILSLSDRDEEEKKRAVLGAWQQLDGNARLVFNKLLSGGFRLGVSQKLMLRALAKFSGIEPNEVAYRLTGKWYPWTHSLQELLEEPDSSADLSKPYPFYLAHAIDFEPKELGDINEWQLEYKWDGIRAQLIIREGECFIWSRGEELITERFPELTELNQSIPNGTVIDGELLAYKEGILPFQHLQTRISRKNISKRILQKAPAVLRAYDLLEWEGEDIRNKPLALRRELLENCVKKANSPRLQLSEVLQAHAWEEAAKIRAHSREVHSEGLMVKSVASPYEQGRKRGKWWKWKVAPLHIDAVLIYAMKGHGQRANLFSDYTFAVWKEDQLLPFTKAYSGLTMAEIKEVDKFVKAHTRERFGPVRSVDPELVFEIAFEGIQESSRHKSGIALRFPRMARWRHDKKAAEAGTLDELQALLKAYGS